MGCDIKGQGKAQKKRHRCTRAGPTGNSEQAGSLIGMMGMRMKGTRGKKANGHIMILIIQVCQPMLGTH